MAGLHELLGRIEHQLLTASDWSLFRAYVLKDLARAEARQERMFAKMAASAAAAERVGGPVIEAEYSINEGDSTCGSSSSEAAAASGEPKSTASGQDEAGAKKPKGHGRNGSGAYTNAKHFFYTLALGVIGALCEACRFGKMYRYREKIVIRIIGQPLFGAEMHHYEQARCRNCGRVVRAAGPDFTDEGVGTDYVRYDWSACAMLIVMHYFGGAPFKRLESLHKGWGIPMPDANQWQLVNASDDHLFPLFRALEQHAIQKATNFRIDDTGAMVIALKKQIQEEIAALERLGESTKAVRTGINATGSYWETPNGPIILFYTGRHHAGEIVDQLLRHRLLKGPKLVKCTDGASKNFDHEHKDKLIESTCNAHAFLKFHDIKDRYPAEYAEAASIYKRVFDNDDQAKAVNLGPVDRMLYHRQHSLPLMEELKKKCEARIKSKLVEPNSPLWEPLTFVINQFDRLVRFCEVPGVPLDTNLVEQALIIPVRYLAGSFNFKTEDGAVVGDHLMSLIATARANDIEPVAYLAECLRHHKDLTKHPDNYLPWVYRERIRKGGAPKPPTTAADEPENYATLRQRSGKAQLEGSPPQIRT
ncbi:MAG: transposase [Candidatus Eremiobacteraeota bacterium]|nr:transposase [Candidatus Eremiobacteraeota bacterium]